MSQKTESVDKIQLTGNPFVDTGLAIIAYLSECSTIDDLTLSDMKSVHGDGLSLARNSIELKSTYQLFSSNCLILQNRIDREQRIINHTKVTLAILNSIGREANRDNLQVIPSSVSSYNFSNKVISRRSFWFVEI